MNSLKYRAAEPADADSVAALHADSWRRTFRGLFRDEFLDSDLVGERLAVWRQRLEQPPDNQFVCLAVAGDELAGFVCLFGAHNPEWGSKIDNLHVARAYQRTGIGTELIRRAAEWLASSYPHCGAFLWVAEPNDNARRFYEALDCRYADTVEGEDPSGGISRTCRCAWNDPATLAKVRSRS